MVLIIVPTMVNKLEPCLRSSRYFMILVAQYYVGQTNLCLSYSGWLTATWLGHINALTRLPTPIDHRVPGAKRSKARSLSKPTLKSNEMQTF
ncbi:hypothetical protein EVAR_5044_1 [Eumeta japonica]|uniref:Uncharacterized protein n=1 Tax=Eumeta variegata TaxID=151549 RepID=A0A4C1SU81_EUMVA|nr:hypothetical protein EVAR_5044_1 [Eumeta japonica]